MSEPIYWTTKDGKKMNVDDMDANHIKNAFKMLLRKIRKHNEELAMQIAIERARANGQRFKIRGEIASQQIEDEILNDLFGEELDELYGG